MLLLFHMYDHQSKRTAAQQALRAFSVAPECIPQCQMILDYSTVYNLQLILVSIHLKIASAQNIIRSCHKQAPYALVLASSSLLTLITTFWNNFSNTQTVDIRNYILNYLVRNVASLIPIVKSNLVQLVARITKLGWNQEPQHQEICSAVAKFLQVFEFPASHIIALFCFINLNTSAVVEPNALYPRLSSPQ